MKRTITKILGRLALAVVILCGVSAGPALAGSLYLSGHDILLHGGQAGYDSVILDYLRGGNAKATYDIAVVGSGVGFASFTGSSGFTGQASGSAIALTGTLTGYGSATYYKTGTGANWATILSADALIILDHTSCGGCDLSTAGSAEVNANDAAIAAAFNAGMDIWGGSGASLATYYDFLPSGAAASGASISGSTGFTATAAGTAIGITSSMINGYPTHNRFTSFAPAFTVFETRGTEMISIGLEGGTITGGEISVATPGSLILLGLGGLGGLVWRRRLSA